MPVPRLKVLTVASPSIMAATMSPFSATGCWRTTTQSPSQIAASIIESPATLSRNSVAVADELAGQREDVLDGLLGEDRPAGGDPADDGDVRRPAAVGRRCRPRRCSAAVPVAVASGSAHLDGARPVGVAAQEALALQRW